MEKQIILAVDDNGEFSGYIPKEEGHIGEGKRHLAITVLLFNNQDQVLLQRRRHKIFDNIWDLTGATHPLNREEGDESWEDATRRCLETEYGIKEKIPLENLGFFNYFAKYGELCENEHCAMIIGEYNGDIKLNLDVGYECKWIGRERFLKDIENNPSKYSAWANKGLKILKRNNFFG